MTWLRAVERLSRSGPSEVADAHHHLRELVGLARVLRPAADAPHLCGVDPCPFAGHPDAAALCTQVLRLAALEIAGAASGGGAEGGAGAPVRVPSSAFLDAVGDAADTVRWCRQTAHPGGDCWFASPHGGDCGDVLKLSHRLA